METRNSKEQQELLQERVSNDELHELLERLGQAELGGPEAPTVGAIVEATGASPVEIGRLLGQIRQEQFEKRFSDTFQDHEHRIEKLESRPVERNRVTYNEEFDEEQREILQEYADREVARRKTGPLVLFLLLVLGLIIIAVANSGTTGHSPNYGPGVTGFGTEDPRTGTRVERTMDGRYLVHNRDGTQRPATADEASQLDAEEAMLHAERRR